MKKILFVFSLFFILVGCQKQTNHFDWEVESNDYIKVVNEAPVNSSIVLVSRNENVETEEKYIQMDFYCRSEDIANMIITLQNNSTVEELKENLMNASKKMNLEIDEYYQGAIDDLEITTDYDTIIDELSKLYQSNSNIILTFKQNEISIQDWDGLSYNVENGSNGSINKETKVYANMYLNLLGEKEQARIDIKVDHENYTLGIHTYSLIKEKTIYWKQNGGFADHNPMEEHETLLIGKSTNNKDSGYLSIEFGSKATIPQDIYEDVSPIYSTFIWNDHLKMKFNEEIVIGYQVLNNDKELVFSEEYFENPELLKDYDVVAITMKIGESEVKE